MMDDDASDKVTIEVSKVLVDRAEEVGLDVARVLERALRREVRQALDGLSPADREALREKIRTEIEIFNQHVEKHGLLSDSFRDFC